MASLYRIGRSAGEPQGSLSGVNAQASCRSNPSPRHRGAGSLAGVVHLSNDNAGVQRRGQKKQKSRVEQEGKSSLDYEF